MHLNLYFNFITALFSFVNFNYNHSSIYRIDILQRRFQSIFFKTALILFFFLGFFFTSSQQVIQYKLDSTLINTPLEMVNKNIPRKEIILWNEKMLSNSQKANYTRGIIIAKINLAVQYYNLSKPDISLKYLIDANKILKTIPSDPSLQAKINQEFSQVYYTMGLFEMALDYNSKAKYWASKTTKNVQNLKLLNYVYTSRSNTLQALKKDSSLHYLHKASYYYKHPNVYIYLATHYIEHKTHLDSAKYYLEKSENIFKNTKHKSNYSISVLFYNYGKLFLAEKKYSEAIKYLEKSLFFANNGKNRQHLLNIYNALIDVYRKTANFEKERNILEDYKKFNETYSDSFTKGIETTLLKLKEEQENDKNKWTKNYILVGLCVLLLFIIIVYRLLKKNTKKILLNKQEEYSVTPSAEINGLIIESNPQVTIDMIYESAKTRDPNFYTKFQSLYPNFVKKLIDINPNLQNSEIQLLMYIFLKFETKEIADFLCLSPKTIQNRKYKIRKKLNIPTCTDIYIWLLSTN